MLLQWKRVCLVSSQGRVNSSWCRAPLDLAWAYPEGCMPNSPLMASLHLNAFTGALTGMKRYFLKGNRRLIAPMNKSYHCNAMWLDAQGAAPASSFHHPVHGLQGKSLRSPARLSPSLVSVLCSWHGSLTAWTGQHVRKSVRTHHQAPGLPAEGPLQKWGSPA